MVHKYLCTYFFPFKKEINRMYKYFLYLVLLFINIVPNIFAQKTDSTESFPFHNFKVDSIKISGNETTKDFVIKREMTFKEGDTVNTKVLEFNKERIFSLGIFSKVELEPKEEGDKNIILIEVKESWYIYPIPFVTIKDDNWKKLSYGINLFLQNFRGRNEKIRAHAAFGFDPNYAFSYYNPYLIYEDEISIDAGVSYSDVQNKSNTAKYLHGGDFDQTVYGLDLTFGKRLSIYHNIFFNLSYKVIETPFYFPGISVSGDRIDHLASAGLTYVYDTRDLKQFARSGFYLLADFSYKGLGINNIKYEVLNFDLRKYEKLFGDLSGKIRASTRFTFGDLVPYYDFSYLGFGDKIRGYYYNQREGNSSFLASFELDYPLLKDFNLNIDFIPILPKKLFSYRVAVYAEIFADAGVTKFNGEPINLKKFDSGYGAGLTFLFLPYSAFRIEYAINDRGKGQWILGFGTSF